MKQQEKKKCHPHSFYCLIDLLNVKPVIKNRDIQSKSTTIDISNSGHIETETKETYTNVNNSKQDISQIHSVFVKSRSTMPSLFTKSDDIPTNCHSQSISKVESECCSPKGRVDYSTIKKLSVSSNNQSEHSAKQVFPTISERKHENLIRSSSHPEKNQAFSQMIESLSLKSTTNRIRQQNKLLAQQMEHKLNKKLQKSCDEYKILRQELSQRVADDKEKYSIIKLDKESEPINAFLKIHEQQLINDKLFSQESINSKQMVEGSLLKDQSYFAKRHRKIDAEEFMKKGLIRINDSPELKFLQQSEKSNKPVIIVRQDLFKNNSQRNLTKKSWDYSMKTNEDKKKVGDKNEKDKIITQWYIPSKFRGKVREELTFDKKYPYANDQEYLYRNLYNIYDIYPGDPYQNNGVKIKNKKKEEQLTHLINFKERLVHAPIIKDLNKKLKDNNQRVPLIIRDAYTKAESNYQHQ